MNAVSKPIEADAFSVAPAELDLLARHDLFFETRIANTTALIETAHALRYQVYCLERRFENPEQHLGGLETDSFDKHAKHGVLFHRPSQKAIGTVRMIAPRCGVTDSLPIMSLLRHDDLELGDYVDMERTVEVSRFAISKEFRRRRTDQFEDVPGVRLNRSNGIREANLACLSLIQFLVRQSVAEGTLYWAAVMEPRLLRMLAGMGIRFTSIGSLVLHHGLRQPCYCHVPTMLEEVRLDHPEYWNVLTNGGALQTALDDAAIRVPAHRPNPPHRLALVAPT
jgi:N-acyl amino acid synthase of PEP-CTERM/exosortase system